ncbi:MAG TPA: GNAT family N-acetyltransferase [Polyangiaceae bacterium]
MDSELVVLTPATPSDGVLLSNLLELYIHDLSDIFTQLELGPDGRFGYPRLPLYFSEPDRRLAYLIRYGSRIAGFALVMRGSPAVEEVDVHDIAEFFVMRRYRRRGVGRRAATLLWQQLPGKWTVRVSEGNPAALAFWTRAVAEHTGGKATQWTRPGDPRAWRVLYFDSHEPGPG